MRKANIVLIILSFMLLTACSNQSGYYTEVEVFDYKAPAKKILEINKKEGTSQEITAAELNEKLVNEDSIAKKAAILKEINDIPK